MILLIKITLAVLLMAVGVGWGVLLRMNGVEGDLGLQGCMTFAGMGILLGTLWEDEK